MNDDLVIGISKEDGTESESNSLEEVEELFYDEMSWTEVIGAVFSAFACIEDIDVGMASPLTRARIKRIRRKGLRLIDVGISEIYAEKFENDENEDD